MRFIFSIGALLMLWNVANAQTSFLPKNLGPSINSTYDDVNPVITPDGKTLFFVRANHPENTYGHHDSEDIWVSTSVNDSTWNNATRIPNLNVGRYNAVLSVSADGNTILLNGILNKNANIWKKRGLSVSTRVGNNWSKPEKLKVKKFTRKNRGMRSSGSMSADGKVIVLSYSKIYNGEKNNIFISTRKKNGRFTKPKKIKRINSRRNEETPFLSSNGNTLFFSSDRTKKGAFNIYKSTHTGKEWKKNWSKPVTLSDTINTQAWESYFKTTPKGSWAYFASTNKSLGKSDIYRVKLFEENPYVIVSGSIVNARTGAPLTGKEFAILANGMAADSVKINTDSATYQVKLRLGKSYKLSAPVQNYIPEEGIVDVTKQKEFTRRKLDLRVSALPYVLVQGKLLVQEKGTPVATEFDPRILVDNKVVDSLKYNALTGMYEVKLKHGFAYEFKAEARKHESTSKRLDLTLKHEYEEINMDLFVEEEKMAVVSGKILDKKTNLPLSKLAAAKVVVEGMASSITTIDTLSGSYELKLPYGKNYTISASVPKYYPLYETIDLTTKTSDVRVTKDLVIVPIEVGQSIRLNNIFFESGKTVLKAESFPELDRVADFLSKNTDIKIEIAGHTDNVGKAATNTKLSQTRAKAVADYVIKKGIAKERVVPKGYGSIKPVADNKTKEGKAQNRRVEFTILDNK
jgi:outer membrane protein OmpA-like peptidoglycan-associated protein